MRSGALSQVREGGEINLSTRQYDFTPQDKRRFIEDPEFFLRFRREIESEINIMFEMYMQGSGVSKNLKKLVTEEMIRRIGPDHSELTKFIIPKWSPGCRRISPADGYLEALTSTNVEPVYGEVDQVTEHGVVGKDGKEHRMDVLVCATGFQPAFQPNFKVLALRL